MGSGLPDAWWFRTDGRRMTRRDWERPDGHVVGVFLNGEEITSPGEHGERVLDDSFIVLFNSSGEEVAFRLPARRFGGAVGARAVHGRAGAGAGRAGVPHARGGAVCRSGRWWCCGGSRDGAPRHLPAPARRRPRLRRRARARPVPARPRHQPPLPVALVPGPARAPRTATTSRTPGASPRSSAARPGSARWPESGLGRDPRHRPEPHGRGRREPLLGRSRAAREVLRRRRRDRPLAALLRHRPPRGGAPGGPGGVRRDAPRWRCGSCARGWWTACASTTPTGSPTPPATCAGCATRAWSGSGSRRSSTRASRCATGRWRGRWATSS